MIIRKPTTIPYSQVTPKHVYLNRRRFLAAGGAAVAALAGPFLAQGAKISDFKKTSYNIGKEKITPLEIVSSYNNYYEFGTGKDEPSQNAPKWKPNPEWPIKIEGEIAKPKTMSLPEILKLAPLEERIYRHRCVERWSIAVPWIGIPLNAVLKAVEPTSKAKYVAFESYYNTKDMPLGKFAGIPLPYVEGLRLDEAMHPLAFLAVGMYGETILNQNGAPVRLVVPWKYGFKSIKSIVRIKLIERQPPTTWNISAANEYGFYSNVNPKRDHPRWSQARERRLGEDLISMRPTLMFNGYEDQVASLYAGMDLIKNY